jgi:hypothetical protein
VRRGAAPALAVLCAAIASLLPTWTHLPILLYDPIARVFRFAPLGATGGPHVEISYYGVYLTALVGWLIGAGLGVGLGRFVARSRLLDAWALTALGVAAAYQITSLWP